MSRSCSNSNCFYHLRHVKKWARGIVEVKMSPRSRLMIRGADYATRKNGDLLLALALGGHLVDGEEFTRSPHQRTQNTREQPGFVKTVPRRTGLVPRARPCVGAKRAKNLVPPSIVWRWAFFIKRGPI